METPISKLELRTSKLRERDAIPEELQKKYSHIIAHTLFNSDFYRAADTIYTYVSFRSEVSTIEIITKALLDGKKVCCPKIVDNKLFFYQIDSPSAFQSGYFGVMEPTGIDVYEEPSDSRNLILTPGSVFDRNGYRIGYGKGFYDRYFWKAHKGTRTLIGLAYDMQIVNDIQPSVLDYPVDYIITENEFMMCKHKNQ